MWKNKRNYIRFSRLKQNCACIKKLLQYLRTLHFIHSAFVRFIRHSEQKTIIFITSIKSTFGQPDPDNGGIIFLRNVGKYLRMEMT
jgi:hypothetical protein